MKDMRHLGYISATDTIIWLCAALMDWAVIAITFAMLFSFDNDIVAQTIWVVLAVFVTGIWRHRLGLLGHEAAHYLICSNHTANHILANIFVFWSNGLRSEANQAFHKRHHVATGTEDDPELKHKAMDRELWRLPVTYGHLMARLTLGLFGGLASEALNIFTMIGPKSWKDLIGPVLWWTVVATAMVHFCGVPHTLMFAVIWIVSTYTTFITVFHLRMLCEHHGTAGTWRIKCGWLFKVCIMPYNEHCHYEHHLYPYIPWHRLEAARRAVDAQKLRSTDYTDPERVLRSLSD